MKVGSENSRSKNYPPLVSLESEFAQNQYHHQALVHGKPLFHP